MREAILDVLQCLGARVLALGRDSDSVCNDSRAMIS